MLVIVWLHLLSVVTWMGGLLFGSHLVAPRLARATEAERGLLGDLLRRFRLVAWMAITLLIVTGSINLAQLLRAAQPLEAGAGRLLALKLFLALIALYLAAHRDFALLPRLLRASSPQEASRPLTTLRWFDRIVLLLLLAILFLGLAVSRGIHGA